MANVFLAGLAALRAASADLRQRQPRMIEKGPAKIGQFDAARAADEQLRTDLIFKIPDLAA
jgi:hypothetical protein